MRPDKPQFWTGGDVNLAMTEITKPDILWKPIKNLTKRTLVDVNIDCREMRKGVVIIIKDGATNSIINTLTQQTIFVNPSQFLSFRTRKIGLDDISTATFSRTAFNIIAHITDPRTMLFNNDGTIFYLLNNSHKTIGEYNLSIPYDISTATFSRTALNIGGTRNLYDIMFNNDGLRLYLLGGNGEWIFQYELTTPYDISTATFSVSLNISAQDTSQRNMLFNNDGMKLFVLGDQHNIIYEYNLSTPYDVSTGTFSRNVLNVSTQTTEPRCMMFNNDGLRLYMLNNSTDNIYEYNLSTPYDISTATFSRNVLNLTGRAFSPQNMIFGGRGRLYILDKQDNNIYEYLMQGIWRGNVKIRTINN